MTITRLACVVRARPIADCTIYYRGASMGSSVSNCHNEQQSFELLPSATHVPSPDAKVELFGHHVTPLLFSAFLMRRFHASTGISWG